MVTWYFTLFNVSKFYLSHIKHYLMKSFTSAKDDFIILLCLMLDNSTCRCGNTGSESVKWRYSLFQLVFLSEYPYDSNPTSIFIEILYLF